MQSIAILLKVSLPKLKLLLLLFVPCTYTIVPIRVGPLQYLSTSDNFVTRIQQEQKFAYWIVLYGLQHLYFTIDYGPQCDCLSFCLVVVVKSLEVKHVSLKFMFSFLTFFLLVLELRVFLLLFKHVTLIVTSSCRPVLFPVSQTNPTKLMSTGLHLTSHVVTTLVFLNSSLTFGTWLRICHNPGKIFRFCGVLHLPKFHNVAIGRLVTL